MWHHHWSVNSFQGWQREMVSWLDLPSIFLEGKELKPLSYFFLFFSLFFLLFSFLKREYGIFIFWKGKGKSGPCIVFAGLPKENKPEIQEVDESGHLRRQRRVRVPSLSVCLDYWVMWMCTDPKTKTQIPRPRQSESLTQLLCSEELEIVFPKGGTYLLLNDFVAQSLQPCAQFPQRKPNIVC